MNSIYSRDTQLHGSAEWASRAYLRSRNYGEKGDIFLGYGLPENNKESCYPITTSTQRHLLTAGSTRSGKLLAASVPRCMDHKGPLVVIDTKDGEITLIVARYRRDVLKRKIVVIDSWGKVTSHLGLEPDSFNTLDWLDPEGDDFFEDAMLVAESIVPDQASTEPFWVDEARALICGLIMYIAATPKILIPTEKKSRDLTQMRRLLNLSPVGFEEMVEGKYLRDENGKEIQLIRAGMAQSSNELVRAAASRIMNKSSREFSGVLSTAQQNTHFLESARIGKSLGSSTFSMEDLESGDIDIFVTLPAGRLFNYHRFLRLLLSIFITAVTRFDSKPNPPVYFLIEEAATLGRLPIIEKAYALLAGYGAQMHMITQDFNQLASIYKGNWQSIIANCGVIQLIGIMDMFTAEYVSKLCGTSSIEALSHTSSETRAGLFSSPSYFSAQDSLTSRALITPHESQTMHPSAQILILANSQPVLAYKPVYFLDSRYRDKRGRPLFDIHPHYKHLPTPKGINFTKSGVDVARIIGDIFMGG